MANHLISTSDLKRWLRYEQTAAVERWLRQHGVRYWPGKDGEPVTTQTEIDRALSAEGAPVEIF